MEDDLTLPELYQFSGTENWHKIALLKAIVTDGVIYLMENGYSWFVTDSVIQAEATIKDQDFLVIKLKVDNGTAKVTIEDGNDNVLHTRQYGYTNAKRDLTIYLTDNVVMLPGEY